MDALEPIAVVGLACRFPGAADAEQFWANLIAGRESVTTLGEQELRAAGLDAAALADPDYVRAAAVMPDADRFDAELFGMSRREALVCDPQFRAFLETCHGALEHAGYDPFGMADSVGVFGGVAANSYVANCLARAPGVIGPSWMLVNSLNHPDYLATLVAYRLNLRGPAMTVLTACSSALAAIHLAAQALRTGECDVAVAGGAAVRTPLGQGYRWTPGGVTSRDGHCRPFDAAASGTVFGSGAGAVVLKRLDDALVAGDHVKAVLLGSAMNNDGSDKVSFGAPSFSGQVAVVMEAMALAGVDPAQVGYVEAHGTGTALGDPVEVAALAEAYARLGGAALPPDHCRLGSVKSNIGHLDNASGVAGFIKTVLALEREVIPGTANLRRVNPRLELAATPFRVDADSCPWPRGSAPRVAGVTSLGVGGTNVHAVLREGPVRRYQPVDGRPRLVVWSAASRPAEGDARRRLAGYFSGAAEAFTDAVATLQHGRTAHRVRAATVCASAAEAAATLSGAAGAPAVVTGEATDDCPVTYLVSGQGTRQLSAAAGLYGTVRAFTIGMDECLELFEDAGVPLYRWWTGGGGDLATAETTLVQPLVFAVGYALGMTWQQWGAPPAAVLGHSLGEITAATLAGVFEMPDAVRLVVGRAAAMAAHPVGGGMLAVAADEDSVRPMLPAGVSVAAVNTARQVVVCGPDDRLRDFRARLRAAGIAARPVPTSAAFHHPGWSLAAAAWERSFHGVTAHPPRVPVYSAALGGLADAVTLSSPKFWTGQLHSPVRFHAALGEALRDAPRVVLEIGPDRTLTGLARRHSGLGGAVAVPTLTDGRDDHRSLLAAAGRLWTAGCRLDWTAAEQPPPVVRPALPGYPYQRARYWVDPPAEPALESPAEPAAESLIEPVVEAAFEPAVEARAVPAREAVGEPPTGPAAVTEIGWVERGRAPAPGTTAEPAPALVLLPDEAERAGAILRAVEAAGLQPVLADPDRAGGLESLLAALAGRGTPPRTVVYAAPSTPAPAGGGAAARLARELAGLLRVCRLLLRPAYWPAPPRLVLLTSGAVDVSGGEPLFAEVAALPPLLRTLRAEVPGMTCSAVDADARTPVTSLAAELAGDHGEPLVALRGRRRWVPVERPVRFAAPAGTVLRENGTYLITGGTGGLGLAVARGLAATGLRPRLVLLSRSGLTADRTGAVERLRELGAEVYGYACDVADPARLDDVLAEVTARLGPVHGLLHLAGVPGGRMVAFRDEPDALAVLAPKAGGWDCLEAAFAGRPALDFAVSFSSLAAVEGLVGGGDYAVANAYLDASAVLSPLAGGRALSIAWPAWREVGMAAESTVDVTRLGRAVRELDAGGDRSAASARRRDRSGSGARPPVWERELSAATHWALDEHRAGRVPLLPATAQLELLLDGYREVAASDGGPIRVGDVVFRAPLLAPAPRSVRLTFEASGPDRHTATVASRPVAGGAWTVHTTAEIGAHGGSAPRVDLDALRERFTGGEPHRGRVNGRGLVIGPRWRNVAASWSVPGERLLRLELSEAYRADFEHHRLHPALLDTATAAVRGSAAGDVLPFLYRSLVVYGDLPARCYVHVRLASGAAADSPTGDLDVITDDGVVVVSVEGFTMRVVDGETMAQMSRPTLDAGRDGRADPGEMPGTTGPTGSAGLAPTDSDGLAPADGVTLLLRLLDVRCSGSVLVRPAGSRARPPADPPAGAPAVAPPAHRPGPAPAPRTGAGGGPATPADERIADLWRRVLGVDALQPDEDFFDAGGDSLSAIELTARVREEFGVQLGIGLLLEVRTYRNLVAALRERGVA